MTTVNKINSNKAKVRDEYIFRSVSLVCFTAELDVSIDWKYRCTCKLIIKTTAAFTYMRRNNCVCVYMF